MRGRLQADRPAAGGCGRYQPARSSKEYGIRGVSRGNRTLSGALWSYWIVGKFTTTASLEPMLRSPDAGGDVHELAPVLGEHDLADETVGGRVLALIEADELQRAEQQGVAVLVTLVKPPALTTPGRIVNT